MIELSENAKYIRKAILILASIIIVFAMLAYASSKKEHANDILKLKGKTLGFDQVRLIIKREQPYSLSEHFGTIWGYKQTILCSYYFEAHGSFKDISIKKPPYIKGFYTPKEDEPGFYLELLDKDNIMLDNIFIPLDETVRMLDADMKYSGLSARSDMTFLDAKIFSQTTAIAVPNNISYGITNE